MLINSYAVVLAFMAIIRLVLAFLLTIQGVRLFRDLNRFRGISNTNLIAERYYFLALSALLLLILNVGSWPLFYALLQSYVSEIPGVMCIYGVTRVGERSLGPARYLPSLIALLQLSKPLLVFIGGSWRHLHVLNVRSSTEPLLKRLACIAVVFGLAATFDAVIEMIYVSIPKIGESAGTGCCTIDRGDRFQPSGIVGTGDHLALYVLFFGGTALLVMALWAVAWRERSTPSVRATSILFLGALALTGVGVPFLVDVAAPCLLGLPFHHCPYDLPMRIPESVVPIAIYIVGGMCIGWIWSTRTLGFNPETMPIMSTYLGSIARIGIWCYVVATTMLALEMALA